MQPGHDVTCTYTARHWDAAPLEAPVRLSRSVRTRPGPASLISSLPMDLSPRLRSLPHAWP